MTVAGCGPLKLDALPEHKLTLALSRGWPATSELLRPYLPHLACLSCIERRRLYSEAEVDVTEPALGPRQPRNARLCTVTRTRSDSQMFTRGPTLLGLGLGAPSPVAAPRFCRGIIGDQARPGWGFKAGHRFPDKPDARPRLDAPAAAGRSGMGPPPARRLLSFPFQVGGAMSLPSSRTQWPISKVAPGHCELKGRRRHESTL